MTTTSSNPTILARAQGPLSRLAAQRSGGATPHALQASYKGGKTMRRNTPFWPRFINNQSSDRWDLARGGSARRPPCPINSSKKLDSPARMGSTSSKRMGMARKPGVGVCGCLEDAGWEGRGHTCS